MANNASSLFASLEATDGPFRAIIESAGEFITVVDSEHVIRYINRVVEGLDRSSVIGSPVYGFVDPAYHDVLRKAVEQTFATGIARDVETSAAGDHGSTSWYLNRLSPLRDGDTVVGVTIMGTDVTREHDAREALRSQQALLRESLDVVDAIIIALDPQARIALLNRPGAGFLGVDPETAVGLSWMDEFVPERDRAATVETFNSLIAGRLAPVEYFENTVLTADGERLVRWHNTILRDAEGSISGTLSFGQDVTDLVDTQERLQEREMLLDSLFSIAPVGLGVLEKRTIVEANDTFCRMLGYEIGELVGTSVRMLYGSDREFERVGEEKGRQLAEHGSARVETRFLTKTGDEIDILLSAAPFEEGGTIEGRLAVSALDITHIHRAQAQLRAHKAELEDEVHARTWELARKNEELRAANQAKTEFLAAMSHELRTPLNSVIGFTGILLNGLAGELSEEQRRQLEMVEGAGKHLLELVNDILDLSRIEAGRTNLKAQSFSLGDFLDTTVGPLRVHASARDLGFDLNVEDPEVVLHTDQRAIRQILLNLLGNALKFTERGRVGVRARVDDDGFAVFEVSDTGIGIPREQIPTLFLPFQHVGKPVDDEYPRGTGLGLSISARLAGWLGGRLDAESVLGKGSTFTLTIPARLPDQDDLEEE
jgi:PAS domain S-box-containing protein